MADLSDLPTAARRAALYAELASLHADKAAIETAIQRVQAELDGRVQDWRELVNFTKVLTG